jgi:hypothetical protein
MNQYVTGKKHAHHIQNLYNYIFKFANYDHHKWVALKSPDWCHKMFASICKDTNIMANHIGFKTKQHNKYPICLQYHWCHHPRYFLYHLKVGHVMKPRMNLYEHENKCS